MSLRLSNEGMRIAILILSGCLFGFGCANTNSSLPTPSGRQKASNASRQPAYVVPATSDTGKIAMVNEGGRFVVITFPLGGVPGGGQRLNVYRQGVKVAELRVTGPQRDNHTVADIVSGEAQVNDDARAD